MGYAMLEVTTGLPGTEAPDILFFLSAYALSISSGDMTLAGIAIPAIGIVLITGLDIPAAFPVLVGETTGETYCPGVYCAYWAVLEVAVVW
jgi:hypothetical protein